MQTMIRITNFTCNFPKVLNFRKGNELSEVELPDQNEKTVLFRPAGSCFIRNSQSLFHHADAG
jgi:hypothetical protein